MNYSLGCSQNSILLKQVQEISIPYKDRKILIDFIQKYPNQIFMIILSSNDIDWKELKNYYIMSQNRCIFQVFDIQQAKRCKKEDIPFFFSTTAKTAYDVEGFLFAGASQVRIEAPLTHSLQELKKRYPELKIRMAPNISYFSGCHDNGIIGGWVRPEDVEFYESFVYIFEFLKCSSKQERVLFEIYIRGEWNGPLNVIISDLNADASNNMIPSEMTLMRLVCNQQCTIGYPCTACKRYFFLSN